MIIEEKCFSQWNESLSNLSSITNYHDIPESLIRTLQVLMPADIGMIAIYGMNKKPINVFDDAPVSIRVQNVDAHLDGAFIFDPFYRAGINGIKSGLYHLRDVAPSGFHQSEYYKLYYKTSLISDEIDFITYFPDGYFANTSFVNVKGSAKFRKSCIERLRLCQPIVEKYLTLYWTKKKELSQSEGSHLHSQLEAVLSRFSTSVLTPRESEVIQLYLHGNSTKSIADRLHISGQTVCLHRKRSYAKLEIRSLSELFHLFIDSLSCIDIEQNCDTLKHYQRSILSV